MSIYKEFLDIENGDEYDYESTSPWIIRFVFNKEDMLEKGIIMEDVYLSIMEYDNTRIKFIFSDENSKQLIGRIMIRIDDDDDEDEEETNGLIDQTDTISIFKNIKQELLENVVIKGIENITNIVLSPISIYIKVDNEYIKVDNEIDNEIENKEIWLLETDGTNLVDIISNDYVDYTKTISNDIIEIFELLGIEATRNALINEITEVVEGEGEYINSRHIELLCDVMTSTGELMSINRQGINRGDIGPLAKCSFEDTTDQLIRAGIFGEIDKLDGVSSNIMMGQRIHAGTNNCEILLDEEKLMNLVKDNIDDEPINEVDEDNIDILFDQTVDDEEGCEDDDFKFSFE